MYSCAENSTRGFFVSLYLGGIYSAHTIRFMQRVAVCQKIYHAFTWVEYIQPIRFGDVVLYPLRSKAFH